ncbi:hypothetical protein PHJA_003007100 [Phtheirospermum japonicum]|uniref:Uncharacterized protein n=1 Tax=Phtheirospermum japonicum TaxID=374723 RepID=A0A830D9F4_9LAMI|nr:hypothetical protein PHJA_003007100 [Phtheirospermum japonicum]
MGCFLTCFGFKKKKKSRRPGKKSHSAHQNHGNYVPLDSDVSIKLDIKENKEKPKEPSKSKIKKKVSFNLNVKTYEPIPNDDDIINYLSDGEEETKWEFNTEAKSTSTLHYTNSIATSYRYKNCRDSYDDDGDDEFEFDENDLDFEESEDSDDEPDEISSNESDDNEVINNRVPGEENINIELQGLKSKVNGQYVFSVLNPVENLTQWKKLKAKAEKGPMKFEKENLNSRLDEESFLGKRPNSDSLNFKKLRNYSNVPRFSERTIAVDASFSNWNTREV